MADEWFNPDITPDKSVVGSIIKPDNNTEQSKQKQQNKINTNKDFFVEIKPTIQKLKLEQTFKENEIRMSRGEIIPPEKMVDEKTVVMYHFVVCMCMCVFLF